MSEEAIRELQGVIYGDAYVEGGGGEFGGILGDIEEIKECLSKLKKRIRDLEEQAEVKGKPEIWAPPEPDDQSGWY